MHLIFAVIITVIQFMFGISGIEEVDLHLMDNEMALSFFDLPNGEATLVQNNRRSVLINTGHKDSRQALKERLKVFEADKIDKLILTNNTAECIGNLEWVIKNYEVETVISSKSILQDIENADFLNDVSLKAWNEDDQYYVLPQLKTKVLYASEDKKALVLMFTFGNQHILYMGIADEEVEQQLLDNYNVDAEILKVGGFGSKEGTMPQFLETVDPQVAVLFHKEGLSPSDQMIERLEEIWIDVYEISHVGTVIIKFKPGSYDVITLPSQS